MTRAPVSPAAGTTAARMRTGTLLDRSRLELNSLVLLATTGLSAAAGFVFWVQTARSYAPADVGVASTLVAAGNVIALAALLGYNIFFVQHLPASTRRDTDLTVGLTAVLGGGTLIAIGYLMVWTRVLGSSLGSITPAQGLLVALTMAAGAVNLATDAVFVGLRRPLVNLVLDGMLMGALKVVLPMVLLAWGSLGVFFAFGIAQTVAAAVSVLVLVVRFGYRPTLRGWRPSLASARGYLSSNYVANLVNLAPVILIPLLVVHRHSAEQAAVFIIPFQISALVCAISYATSQAMFAEASRAPDQVDRILRRGLLLQLGGVTAAAVVVAVCATPLLRLFGSVYAASARPVLWLLLLAAVAVTLNTWTQMVLRVRGRTAALVVANLVGLVVVVVVCVLGLSSGVAWAAVALGAGNLAAAGWGQLRLRTGTRGGLR